MSLLNEIDSITNKYNIAVAKSKAFDNVTPVQRLRTIRSELTSKGVGFSEIKLINDIAMALGIVTNLPANDFIGGSRFTRQLTVDRVLTTIITKLEKGAP